jgi:DNA-binding protein HU-beta
LEHIMKKSDLVKSLAAEHGITMALARRILNGLVQTVQRTVVAGQRVSLPGLGSFTSAPRPARSLTTPRGIKLDVPAYRAVRFSAHKAFRDAVRAPKPSKAVRPAK